MFNRRRIRRGVPGRRRSRRRPGTIDMAVPGRGSGSGRHGGVRLVGRRRRPPGPLLPRESRGRPSRRWGIPDRGSRRKAFGVGLRYGVSRPWRKSGGPRDGRGGTRRS